jgi:ABC-type phosphate transport system substrate-binding protein
MLIPSHFADASKASAVKAFLRWMLVDGEKFATGLYYAPLPKAVIDLETKQIDRIK